VSQPTFDEILKAWILEYDERLPSERRERREAFIVLFGNLQDHGFGKEEINSSKKEKIVRCCVNPNHRDKKRLRTWISMVLNDLESAILIYYGSIKIRRDVVTPEMAAKLESMDVKAAEMRALKRPDDGKDNEDDVHDDRFSLDPGQLNLGKENSKPITDARVIETTNDMLEQMAGPEVIWDSDLIKELGIQIDE
jgi:hypothetical protein